MTSTKIIIRLVFGEDWKDTYVTVRQFIIQLGQLPDRTIKKLAKAKNSNVACLEADR